MRRIGWFTLLVLSLGVAGGLLLARPALASGGGGCGRPVSDAHGTRVTIEGFCFGPTVLHVRVGGEVRFTNRDPFPHNVQGASVAWGSWDMIKPQRSVTYRFVRAGVYPYVCSLHPGMVGAVVAGDGNGPGGAGVTTTTRGPVVPVSHARAVRAELAPVGEDSSMPWPLAALVGIGLLAVAGMAGLQLRQQMKA